MKLNYAISTLTEHIAALETELGVKLVESHGKRTSLTRNGEVFLPYAKQILAEYHEACSRMACMSSVSGPLRVLTSESLGLYRMAPILADFARAYPEVELSITLEQPTGPFEKLRNREGDVYFCFGLHMLESQEFAVRQIFQEPLAFFTYPQHRLARKKAVYPRDFKGERFILPSKDCFYRDAIQNCLQRDGVDLQIKMSLDSSSLIRQYVKRQHGVSALPLSVVQEDIKRGELTLLNWQGEIFESIAQAITLKKDWVPPSIQALLDYAARGANQPRSDSGT